MPSDASTPSAASAAIVSFIAAPGHIRHVGADPFLMFGELDNPKSDRVDAHSRAMTAAGVAAEVPRDIHRAMWTKFLFIAPMSGIGAVTRVPTGVWRAIPEIARPRHARDRGDHRRRARPRRASSRPTRSTPRWRATTASRRTPRSSLQRDIIEGKPSELDAQLGAVVRMGREAGVVTPIHELLYHCLLPQEQLARQNAAR